MGAGEVIPPLSPLAALPEGHCSVPRTNVGHSYPQATTVLGDLPSTSNPLRHLITYTTHLHRHYWVTVIIFLFFLRNLSTII